MKAAHLPTAIAATALVAVLIVSPLGMSPFYISFFVSTFMSVALAASWNLFSGMTGYVSLGHGVFFGLGAYAFAVSVGNFGVTPAFGFVLSAVIPGIVALAFGLLLLTARMRIAYFAVIMLGLNEIAKTVAANVKSIGSSYGLTLPPLSNRFFAYYFLLGLAVAVTLFAFAVVRSRWGYGLKAIIADEIAAEMTGIGTVGHKLAMFVASAVFIGVTGAMVSWYWSYVDPYMAFDLTISFDMLVMAVFGGFGTVMGPVLGAVVMSAAREYLSTTLPHFHVIIFGALVIVLVIWCPGGLIQAFDLLRGRLTHKTRPATTPVI
jgi:branched-chain amino acid transport system permease protein